MQHDLPISRTTQSAWRETWGQPRRVCEYFPRRFFAYSKGQGTQQLRAAPSGAGRDCANGARCFEPMCSSIDRRHCRPAVVSDKRSELVSDIQPSDVVARLRDTKRELCVQHDLGGDVINEDGTEVMFLA